jgi:hypothetical protein
MAVPSDGGEEDDQGSPIVETQPEMWLAWSMRNASIQARPAV